MRKKKQTKSTKLPLSFRPILWGLDWKKLSIQRDKEDIIVNTINEGTIDQWQWIRKQYGDHMIRSTMKHRLVSEFHPESLRLASVVFSFNPH
jgi:hypothetical protein